jgi:hypothetical protein
MSNIQTYYTIVSEITNAFIEKHFTTDAEYYWVGEEIADVLFINDYWLQWKEILFCMEENISEEQFFECYSRFEAGIYDKHPKHLIQFLREIKA